MFKSRRETCLKEVLSIFEVYTTMGYVSFRAEVLCSGVSDIKHVVWNIPHMSWKAPLKKHVIN